MWEFPVDLITVESARYFKCEPSSVDVRVLDDNAALVQIGKKVWMVLTSEEFSNQLKGISLDPHRAQLIPVDIWDQVSEDLLQKEEYLTRLKNVMEDEGKMEILTKALSADSPWSTLHKLDRNSYGKAIKTAVDFNELYAFELIDHHEVLGEIFFNQLENGFFDRLEVTEDGETKYFYLYSFDDYS